MINKKIEAALNRQIAQELSSAYVYLSMSAYFQSQNLSGFAHWTYLHYQEENSHSKKIIDYINDREGCVVLEQVNKPKSNWKSIVNVFEDMLLLEQHTTKAINRLMELARSEKDYATENMLQWFIAEQVEEEAIITELLYKVKLVQNSASGLLSLNRELGERKP